MLKNATFFWFYFADNQLFSNSETLDGYLKSDNVSGAFSFNNPGVLAGKSILLVDDIFDSGATIKELGKLFTNFGVIKIAPMVIARTVGGDIM